MKFPLYGVIGVVLLASVGVVAATPTEIVLASTEEYTPTGSRYYLYQVTCSDKNLRTISLWDEKTRWCVGNQHIRCFSTRLEAAQQVCK